MYDINILERKIDYLNLKDAHIAIFGVSELSQRYYDLFFRDLDVMCFVENNGNSGGSNNSERAELFGLNVFVPDKLDREDENLKILIIDEKYEEIVFWLERNGFGDFFNPRFFVLNKDSLFTEEIYEKTKRVLSLIKEEKSRLIYKNIVFNWINSSQAFSNLTEGNQYVVDCIIENLSDEEIIIDAGAFTGDSIKLFINRFGEKIKKIYAFEPCRANYEAALENIKLLDKDGKITIYNCGVYDKETETALQFRADGSGSTLLERLDDETFITVKGSPPHFIKGQELKRQQLQQEMEIAKTQRLDNLCKDKITYIKMDVEGAELNALKGAAELIQENKPKLAISLYHSMSDLWDIPLFINEIAPCYDYYIRHHSYNRWESMLYAIPR